MKQIETFYPPSKDTMEVFGLDEHVDAQYYGTDGGIHLSYPRFATEMDKVWLESMRRLGNPSNANVCRVLDVTYSHTTHSQPVEIT